MDLYAALLSVALVARDYTAFTFHHLTKLHLYRVSPYCRSRFMDPNAGQLTKRIYSRSDWCNGVWDKLPQGSAVTSADTQIPFQHCMTTEGSQRQNKPEPFSHFNTILACDKQTVRHKATIWQKTGRLQCRLCYRKEKICLIVRSFSWDLDDPSQCHRQVLWQRRLCQWCATCMQSRRSCPIPSHGSAITNSNFTLHWPPPIL